MWRPIKESVQNIKPPLDYMDNQALLCDLEQACSTIYATRLASSKFGLHARTVNYNTQYK
jgi:hypothetical protein